MVSRKFCALQINLTEKALPTFQLSLPKKLAGVHCYDAVPKQQDEYFNLQPTLKISKFTCISSA